MHINTTKQQYTGQDDYSDAFRYFLESHRILGKHKFNFPSVKLLNKENTMEDLEKFIGKEVEIELVKLGQKVMVEGIVKRNDNDTIFLHHNDKRFNNVLLTATIYPDGIYQYCWCVSNGMYVQYSIKLVNLKDEINARIDTMAKKLNEKFASAETNAEKIKAYELAIKYSEVIEKAGVKTSPGTNLITQDSTGNIITPSVIHCKEQIKKLKEAYVAKLVVGHVGHDDLFVEINGNVIVILNSNGMLVNFTTQNDYCLETYNKWLTTGMKVDDTIVGFNGRKYRLDNNNQYLSCDNRVFFNLAEMRGCINTLPHINKYANNVPIIY